MASATLKPIPSDPRNLVDAHPEAFSGGCFGSCCPVPGCEGQVHQMPAGPLPPSR
jgi:hypothetical protein